MKYLTQFTPAENLLVLEGRRTLFKDQLKFTLMDLFFKKVLEPIEIRRQASKRDPETVSNYIIIGDHFSGYTPEPHEIIFLAPYLKSKNVKILFRHLVKMGFENARSPQKFARLVMSGKTSPFFKMNWFYKIFGGFAYTFQGRQAQVEIQNEVEMLRYKLTSGELLTSNVQQLIDQVHGNICLTSVDMALINTIDKNLDEAITHTPGNNSYGAGWSSCGSWSSFDSACGSGWGCGNAGCTSSGCSGSGCSSSGCSGCSGCGGCGGGCGS